MRACNDPEAWNVDNPVLGFLFRPIPVPSYSRHPRFISRPSSRQCICVHNAVSDLRSGHAAEPCPALESLKVHFPFTHTGPSLARSHWVCTWLIFQNPLSAGRMFFGWCTGIWNRHTNPQKIASFIRVFRPWLVCRKMMPGTSDTASCFH